MASAMGKRLEGKTVVVTGASSGIGKSTALEFARTSPKNLKLILTARRIDKVKEVAEEIKKEVGDGVKVCPVQLDISKADVVRSFVSNLPKEFQEIDVLVNNAGMVKGVDKAGDIKEEDMNIMFDTNVTGLINMTQAVLKVMKKRGESGQGDIINIGSIAGRAGYPGGSIYCASKAAVRTFTEAMRMELIATRIRIIVIDPGQVETEFSLVRFGGDKEKADAVYKGVTALTGEDIAETIVFAAGRPENVVIADMLVFPNHQVRSFVLPSWMEADLVGRLLPPSCTENHRGHGSDSLLGERSIFVQKEHSSAVEDVSSFPRQEDYSHHGGEIYIVQNDIHDLESGRRYRIEESYSLLSDGVSQSHETLSRRTLSAAFHWVPHETRKSVQPRNQLIYLLLGMPQSFDDVLVATFTRRPFSVREINHFDFERDRRRLLILLFLLDTLLHLKRSRRSLINPRRLRLTAHKSSQRLVITFVDDEDTCTVHPALVLLQHMSRLRDLR